MTRLTILVLWALAALPTVAQEPIIDHQPVTCSLPGKPPRICALVADDGEVKRVDVFFRSTLREAYYRSALEWDGVRYCATLPIPGKKTAALDYHLRAIDDQAGSKRTIDFELRIDAACEFPVFDDDPERAARLVFFATTAKQGRKLRDFEVAGVRFVPIGRR